MKVEVIAGFAVAAFGVSAAAASAGVVDGRVAGPRALTVHSAVADAKVAGPRTSMSDTIAVADAKVAGASARASVRTVRSGAVKPRPLIDLNAPRTRR